MLCHCNREFNDNTQETRSFNTAILSPHHHVIQGIITLMAAVLGPEFFEHCYTPLGELMDLLALTNCAINFILYSLMSRWLGSHPTRFITDFSPRQFRITFRKTFHLRQSSLGSDQSLARDKRGSPSQLPPKAEYSMVRRSSHPHGRLLSLLHTITI